MTVLIVGQNPSKHNIDLAKAFVGSKSGRTLMSWITQVGLDQEHNVLVNCSDDTDFKLNKKNTYKAFFKIGGHMAAYQPDKVLSLGKVAHRVLSEAGVNHFELPHPSGRNRKLNDKRWLAKQLRLCKDYVYG